MQYEGDIIKIMRIGLQGQCQSIQNPNILIALEAFRERSHPNPVIEAFAWINCHSNCSWKSIDILFAAYCEKNMFYSFTLSCNLCLMSEMSERTSSCVLDTTSSSFVFYHHRSSLYSCLCTNKKWSASILLTKAT